MKLSHVIVAIVFFILGAVSMLAARISIAPKAPVVTAQTAPRQGGSSGFAIGGTVMGKSFAYRRETTTPSRAGAKPVSFRIEQDVNRHGSDYRDFAMAAKDDVAACQKACADEAKCLAFTFVKAGVQGASPHCWLKNTVPQAYPDTSCISGVKE